MIRTQIQLTVQQMQWLKHKASQENISLAAVIRNSVDQVMKTTHVPDQAALKQRARQAAGRLSGPDNLAEKHDDSLAGAYEQ